MKRLAGYEAIVTGGARGIGKAICELFAEHGAKTAVTDILDDEGRNLVREIKGKGGEAEFFHLDTSDESEVKDPPTELSAHRSTRPAMHRRGRCAS